MAEDKRKYQRIVINAFVRFYQESRSHSAPYYLQGVIKNYSRGGAFIATKHLLPKGCLIALEIPVEETETKHIAIVQIRGMVRRVQTDPDNEGLGIEFFELKDSEHEDFQEWMDRLAE